MTEDELCKLHQKVLDLERILRIMGPTLLDIRENPYFNDGKVPDDVASLDQALGYPRCKHRRIFSLEDEVECQACGKKLKPGTGVWE